MPFITTVVPLPSIPSIHRDPCHLQLHILVNQPHLLPRLESWQPNVRAPITPERIPQRAISTATDLSLHREINFGELVRIELRC